MKFLLLLAFFFSPAHSHEGGENYLHVKALGGGKLAVAWDLPTAYVQDLFLEQPRNPDELLASAKKYRKEIAMLAEGDLAIGDGMKPCALRRVSQLEKLFNEKVYAVLVFEADCGQAIPEMIGVRWKFRESDSAAIPLLISIESEKGLVTLMSSNQKGEVKISLAPKKSPGFGQFIVGGIFHIWHGVDHLLFLLTLLLPAVFALTGRSWVPRSNSRSAVLDVVKTVSAFTLAHSITLCLVTFGLLALPARLVESVIALSVLLAALNNLFPLMGEGRWKLAFLFGLVHGVSFAEVLTGLGLPLRDLLLALVGYNMGVEAGQLAIVCAFLPFALTLRGTVFYRRVLFQGGSLVACLVSSLWLLDRALGLGLMPF